MIGGPLGSLTDEASDAVISLSASEGEKYMTSRASPGAIPWMACMSMFHSMLPLVSEKLPPAGVWTTETGSAGRPCSASNACRSEITESVAPLPRIATDWPWPVTPGGCS